VTRLYELVGKRAAAFSTLLGVPEVGAMVNPAARIRSTGLAPSE
jgi:hypothetical protein